MAALVTWSPTDKDSSITLSSSNRAATKTGTSGVYGSVRATMGVDAATGTAYFEALCDLDGSPAYAIVGVMPASSALNSFCGADADSYGYQGSAGNIVNNSVAYATYTAFAPITRIGILLKEGALYFGIISGGAITWQGGADPATNTNPTVTGLTGTYFPTFSGNWNPSSVTGCFSAEDQVINDWPAWDGLPAGDAHYLQTTALLHFDDTSGSTTFVDHAHSPQVWTANGSAATASAAALYGPCGIDLTAGYLSTPATDDFNFAYSDFTIEGWCYGEAAGNNCLFDTRDTGVSGFGLYKSVSGSLANQLSWANDTAIVATGADSFTAGWNHWELTKKGDQVRGFLNGALQFTSTDSRVTATAQPCKIGANSAGAQQAGCFFDEVRITNGWARHTESFVPPIKAFPNAVPAYAPDPFFANVAYLITGASPLANEGPGTEYPSFGSGTSTLPSFFRAYQTYQPTSIYFQAASYCALNVYGAAGGGSTPMPALGSQSFVYECFFGTGNSGADPYARLMQTTAGGDITSSLSLTFVDPSGPLGNLSYSSSVGGTSFDGPTDDMGWAMTPGRHYMAFVFDRDSSPGDVIASLYVDSDTGSGFSGVATQVYTRTWSSVGPLYNFGDTAWCNGGQSGGPSRDNNSFMEQIRATVGTVRGYTGASISTPPGPFPLGAPSGLDADITEAVTATDAVGAVLGGLTGDVEETADAEDATAASFAAVNSLQEFGAASDATDATAGTSPSIMIETANATDVQTVSIAQFNRTVIEAGNAIDTEDARIGLVTDIEEAATATETEDAPNFGYSRALTEAGTAQESISTYTDKPVHLLEAGAATEAVFASFAVTGSIVETGNATDATAASSNKPAAVAEVAAAIDTVTGSMSSHESIVEAANATDVLSTSTAKASAIVEAGAALDHVTSAASFPVAISEAAAATDTPTAAATPTRGIVEAANATDVVTKSASAGTASIAEQANATDTVQGSQNKPASIVEVANAQDSVDGISVAHYIAALLEAGAATDEIDVVFDLFSSIVELSCARDFMSIVDVSGYIPNNPATWLAEYRRHVWIAQGRQ